MSFDEEHLDDHYECQREVAALQSRVNELEAALYKIAAYYPLPALTAAEALVVARTVLPQDDLLHPNPKCKECLGRGWIDKKTYNQFGELIHTIHIDCTACFPTSGETEHG